MEQTKYCQSCAMPLDAEQLGTNADGSKNEDYCCYCFKDGQFTTEDTMEDMIEICVPYVSTGNPYSNEDEARTALKKIFPNLKRWSKA